MHLDSIIFSVDGREDLLKDIVTCFSNTPMNEVPLIGKINIQKFSDGEVCTDFTSSVRGKRVYLISSPNTSDKIMQLNFAIDAAKRASATEIIPIVPYFPYARQDKKDQARGPIGAKVMAEMLENRGATTIITFDLHADQIQGFFNIPVTHLEGKYVFDKYIKKVCTNEGDVILCSPDAGAAKRTSHYVKRMKKHDIELDMVLINKTREKANKVEKMTLIGDVTGKNVIIIDDMCDTGGTLCKAADHLIEAGATSVRAIVTHGVLSGPAFTRIANSQLHNFVCSDTLPVPATVKVDGEDTPTEDVVFIIKCAEQIKLAITAINTNKSIEELKTK